MSFNLTQGQQIEISGEIIDAKSKQGIPFANIALKEIYKGTASNSLGEFSFKVDSLPIILVITHLSFEPLEVEVKNDKPLVIKLTAGKLLMDELVIKAKGNNNYAYDLVKKAYYRISSQYSKDHYGKAFYRQISKNGEEYSELYEMFYDTRYNQNGVDDWAIQEGRYALKLSAADSFIYNKNFTLMVRLLTVIQPKTEDLIMPISEHVREQYDLSLSEVLFVNKRRVAQVKFTKKKYVKFPAMEGELFIDLENYNVLKIIGKIVDDDLKFITLKGKNGSWKNYEVSCEIAFKPLDDKILALDYMRLGQNFDYYFDGVFANKVETRSFLTYYEYYTPPKRKKLGGRLTRFNRSDSEILDNIGYNQDFWDENIIVKRTPIESEVISSFEAERSFGSIYLNNKNQIVLEDYEMDKDPFVVKVKNQLKNYVLPRFGEKVYLHHDKPFYTVGENMWIKSYLVNMATNIPSQKNGNLYVELISPEGSLLFSKLCQLKNGTWQGQFAISDSLPSGEYTIQAYTDWMKKFDEKLFFTKNIEIYDPSESGGMYQRIIKDSISALKFYPEGGKLIESMPMQVGFSVTDQFGKGLEIKGKLIGDDGRQVTQIKDNTRGVGSFFVMPKRNFQYTPMISSHEIESAAFPEVINSGYSIMVNMLKPNAIDISVRGTMKFEGKKFYLLVISNGILYDRRIGTLTRGIFKAEIPKANLPIGISQILLVDELEDIYCRRQVFINQPQEVSVKYYLAKKEFRSRERIDMVLELNDENGKAVSNADISISVLDRDKITRNNLGSSIRSYFNLEYRADNEIADPEQVFLDHDRETLKQTDWIMLSQQSAIPQIDSFNKAAKKQDVENRRDNQLDLSGLVLEKETGNPLANSAITIICYPDFSNGFVIANTDSNGRFSIKDVNSSKATRVLVVASDSSGRFTDIEVLFDEKKSTFIPEIRASVSEEISRQKLDYINDEKERLVKYGILKDQSNPITFKFPSIIGKPDNSALIDDNYDKASDIMEVLDGRFPGVNVTGKGKDQKIRIRGEQGPPMILRDGIMIFDPLIEGLGEMNLDESLVAIISAINKEDIFKIDVVKEVAKGSYFAGKVKNGIVALYSNSDKNPELKPGAVGVFNTVLPGYDGVEEFSSPDYSDKSKVIKGLDERTTLYWNPQVQTNRRGRAKISFYNSDVAKSLQICIEGMSEEGVPIFNIFNIGKNAGRRNTN